MSAWHYEHNGQRLGSVSEEEIGNLIAARVIGPDTLVWRQGQADWTPLSKTDLASKLRSLNTPPALPAEKISHVIVWILAFTPLIAAFLQGFIGGIIYGSDTDLDVIMRRTWYFPILMNIGLSYLDEYKLRQAGVDTSDFGKMAWLVPVYLWKRAKTLKQTPVYFWIWVAMFVLSLFGDS
ncbi:hypothetical protein AYM40_21620 [Paraburkholderia phytofirmans OLGA172]|uniref:GYF domain-containing protein n=1 Tax=Paraburkholderia phytofirmans OLGA172 TaxID=1417228 RepID=A0A160FR96_9BURK|nr:DUF4339 domain-containing protein [Paraburkholderia phytofirmans]ANB75028.1 hypothetical protein AYM40_21620 [Paraburkholderia phytofirmans OLGA172]